MVHVPLSAAAGGPPDTVRGSHARVERHALVRRLLGTRARVVVVAAPAGYGKTTLLRQAADQARRRVVYALLDDHANDPAVLVSVLADALAPLGLPKTAGAGWSLDELDRGALELVKWLSFRPPLLLQLDDVHAITERPARRLLQTLLGDGPANVRFMLASRGKPGLALGRLRAAGDVEEIGAVDLRLSPAEAAELVQHLAGPLDERTLRRLWRSMEGWAAGLQLAALALAGGGEPDTVVRALRGSRGAVAEYLLEEVVAQQPPDVQRFLLDTAILDRLVPELCDAVRESSDSAAQLAQLIRRQLLVSPVTDQGGAYHYSGAFRDLLQAELGQADRPYIRALHRRAAAWYAAHEDPVAELTHLRLGGETAAAIDVLAANAMALLTRGQLATVERCIESFGTQDVQRSAPLALAAAWTAVFSGRPASALRHAAAAELAGWAGPLPDGTASVMSAVAVLRSAVGSGTLDEARALAERAIELEPELSPWRPSGHLQHGIILLIAGDLERAETEIERAAELAAAFQPAVYLSAVAYRAHIALARGDGVSAEQTADRVVAMIQDGGLEQFPPVAFPYAVTGGILAARGRARPARQLLERALGLLGAIAFVFPPVDVWARTVIAEGLIELGEAESARRVLADARRLLDRHELDERLACRVHRLEAALDRRERFYEPLTAREREILVMLASVQPLKDIARQLVVSENTVKTHVRRIYRKLEAPNRRVAVRRARELGLLSAAGVEVGRR
jgi:ATP/maltotriose-dependent transcriptional regulator MalT